MTTIDEAAEAWAREHGCQGIMSCSSSPLQAFEAGWASGEADQRAGILMLIDWWAADYAKSPADYSQDAAIALTNLAKLLREPL